MDSWTTICFLLSVNSQNTLHILTQNTYCIRHLITMKISIFNLYHYWNSFKRSDRLQKNHVHRLLLVKKHAFPCVAWASIFQVTWRRKYNYWESQSAITSSSHTLSHRGTCASARDLPPHLTVIPSLRVLGFAWVKIYEQKSSDFFWKFSSSWLSRTSSIWGINFLSLVSQSKAKHFLFG